MSVVKCSRLGQLWACTSVTKYRPRHMWRVEGGPDVGNIILPVSVACNILLARDSASPLQKLGHGHRLKGQRQPEDKRMTGKAKGGGRKSLEVDSGSKIPALIVAVIGRAVGNDNSEGVCFSSVFHLKVTVHSYSSV